MEHSIDDFKKQVAWRAVEEVRPGMVVGLGHGSTTAHAVRRLAERLRTGELPGVHAVACSEQVARMAAGLAIPLSSLDRTPIVDLTIDGADEVDPELDLIKGGGGALLREKIVAQASRRVLIVVDESKLSPVLGTLWAVPVEVAPFGWSVEALYLRSLGAKTKIRVAADGSRFVTDQANYILDCNFGALNDKHGLVALLDARAGIMAHGIFLGLASEVLVGGPEGVRVLTHVQREECRL